MRHISFALTTGQVRNRTKTVTRRLGWAWLAPGTLLQPVEQGQGLKKGQKVTKIGSPIKVKSVRREELVTMCDEPYGAAEAAREGFPHLDGLGFVEMFMAHRRCSPVEEVTRIEFEYVE